MPLKPVQNRSIKFREKIGYIEKKIPDLTGLVPAAFVNAKISEAENKIPDVSTLVKKIDYDF